MKPLAVIIAILLASLAPAQSPTPNAEQPTMKDQPVASTPDLALQPATVQPQTEPPEMALVADLPHPEKYAVAFLPTEPGHSNESVAFLVAPDGKIGTVPMAKLGDASKAGYRPFTVGDLLAITKAVADEEKNLQRKTKELSEDYDALVARYNRLAAINSTMPVQVQPVRDDREAMKMLMLQSLFQKTPTRMQIDLRTTDCTKLPALCVGH